MECPRKTVEGKTFRQVNIHSCLDTGLKKGGVRH
jgi:hypothetical protein